MSKLENLASAAAELSANPRELGAWWRVAEAYGELGETRACVDACSDLGRAASELGVVGLAVACALRMREAGAARDSDALIDRVAQAHCKGSRRVDAGQSAVPPEPPASRPSGESAGEERDARRAATRAMKAAAKDARARAPRSLPPTPLIRFLAPDELRALVALMTMKRYQRGDVVIEAGDDADALYWIARGSAEVSKGDRLLGELYSDAFFGEIALVGASTRTARVACLEESDLLVIPAAAVGDMAVKAPSLAKVLASHARSRLLSNVMRTSELFRRLSAEERRSLLPRFESFYAEEGEALIERGKPNDSLFVVVSGRCAVKDGESTVSVLEVGDGFGEMSMLGRKEATFDVVATEPALLLRVTRDKFDEIAMAHPELLAEVYKLLVARERENDAIIHDADELVI